MFAERAVKHFAGFNEREEGTGEEERHKDVKLRRCEKFGGCGDTCQNQRQPDAVDY